MFSVLLLSCVFCFFKLGYKSFIKYVVWIFSPNLWLSVLLCEYFFLISRSFTFLGSLIYSVFSFMVNTFCVLRNLGVTWGCKGGVLCFLLETFFSFYIYVFNPSQIKIFIWLEIEIQVFMNSQSFVLVPFVVKIFLIEFLMHLLKNNLIFICMSLFIDCILCSALNTIAL